MWGHLSPTLETKPVYEVDEVGNGWRDGVGGVEKGFFPGDSDTVKFPSETTLEAGFMPEIFGYLNLYY